MRIRFWIAAAIALGGAMPAGAADAPYPDRPVRVFVGLAPGGGTDSVARVLAQKLAEVFRQTFVVDNRPGAGGNVAGEMAARSAPDGHTLIVVTPTHVVNPSLYRDVRYDALKDFTPICLLVHSQYYLSVANAVPAATVKELIALAKTRNPRLTYASSGIGSANHLSGALFTHMAGIEMTHVPYKGGAPALAALIAGEVQISFTSSVAITQAKAGRLKTLAVTGAKRSPIAPDVPTIAESGVAGYEVTGWYGISAPAKTARPIVQRLNTTINRVLPELQDRYTALGLDLAGGTPEEFGAHLKSELEKWAGVVKLTGARAN
jgi:tripartite-type tricarboxylate transporter receptor subunit TctC